MSYRFRFILTQFAVYGTTESYFSGSCRTEFLVEPTNTTDRRRQMGTIIGRPRKDGSKAFIAQIVIKRDGVIVHREVQTFDRKPVATTSRICRTSSRSRDRPGIPLRTRLRDTLE